MTFLTAWAVDGSRSRAEMGRRMLWWAKGGATGVVQAGDLVVKPTNVPGSQVTIGPGAATMENRYPGAAGQEYGVFNNQDVAIDIPATGSGAGATRYVIVRIDDPEYPGQQVPVDPLTAAYCHPEVVSSITDLNYPFVALATITQPASTSTITAAMIEDIREMARPQSKRNLIARAGQSSDPDQVLNSIDTVDGELWPQFTFDVKIPSWATQAKIIGTWDQIYVPASSNAYGQVWVRLGDLTTAHAAFDVGAVTNNQRLGFRAADNLAIPESMRGLTVPTQLRARYIESGRPTTSKRLKADKGTSLSIDIEFLEVPTQ